MAAVAAAPGAPQVGVEVNDSELVRRLRRGDERAFDQLYHRYHRRITAYIHGMVHDHARAEDIAQDVFVSALRRIRDTDRPIAFKPWIYEIAKNACIDQFRRSRRAEEVSYDAEEGLGAADYGRLVSTSAMPESELESKQQLDHLRGAFGGLSETHHEILVMRELEGLSYRQIGERLGMSRPSVESTLFRARRRLTEEYEELVSGARCQRIQTIIGTAMGGEVGLRDQRRLARHVSHCQPCRRQARLAGLDIPVTSDRPVRQRVAAMLPLPLFLRRRWLGGDDSGTTAQSVATAHLNQLAQFSAQLGATVDPSWVKAAAAAASVAMIGVGAGLAVRQPTVTGGLRSVSPITHSRGGVDDRLAAQTAHTHLTFGRGFETATSARTPATHVKKAVGGGATHGGAGTTAGGQAKPSAPQQASNTPGVPSVSGVPGSPSVPTSPPSAPTVSVPGVPNGPAVSAPSVTVPATAPTVSVPSVTVQAPDVGSTVQGAAGTATGAAGAAQQTLSGALGN